MKFEERVDGEYRIYTGALDVLRGDGYIAAVVVTRMGAQKTKDQEVFRDESLACGHRWLSADDALSFALGKAREWISSERLRVTSLPPTKPTRLRNALAM